MSQPRTPQPDQPRILLLDIETAPNIAYVWSLFNNNYINVNQIVANSHMLCVSAKWLGDKEVKFYSLPKGHEAMLKGIHKMIDEADVVVHYNGTKFDIPNLNREFVLAGMPPTSPIKQVDLLKVVRRQFKFSSNKLDFVCQQLGLGTKVKHKGMELWRDCMAGDKAAWAVMKQYNIQDVVLLETLYRVLVPWIANHPNVTMYTKVPEACPRCGSLKFQSRGTTHTQTLSYKRYQCSSCHGWFKGAKDDTVPKIEHTPIN